MPPAVLHSPPGTAFPRPMGLTSVTVLKFDYDQAFGRNIGWVSRAGNTLSFDENGMPTY